MKKRNHLLTNLCLFISTFYAIALLGAAESTSFIFNKATFEQNAQLYGNKTANLIELQTITQHLNQLVGQERFAVPPFFGLSNQAIQNYLNKTAYNESQSVWAYILSRWELFKQHQSPDSMSMSDDARQALSAIRQAIMETAFDAHAIVENKEQLDTFLNQAKERNQLLMVRSTSREDSKELSNAGGNASVTSVPIETEALSNAIKIVLASYFSEKSIGQRLIGRDKLLFAEPFMAVLLQVMIGEGSGISKEIPRSGVIFNPEAEGNTPGVTTIQATFGHNEAVVNGLVPVDTYYAGPLLANDASIIHPVIRIKRQRLATLPGDTALQPVDNDQYLQKSSTLNTEHVTLLKKAADTIAAFYGFGIDAEFVIQDNIIYLVQTRPLEDKTLNPSYLNNDFVKQLAPHQQLQVTPIGVGNAQVRVIYAPDELIVTDNIRKALDLFLFTIADKSNIKAVIINEMAPATSHEATQFRRLGIPVLYTAELDEAKKLVPALATEQTAATAASSAASSSSSTSSTTTGPLLIDAQRALLATFINTNFESPSTVITAGWFAHPIAKQQSVMADFAPKIEPEQMAAIAPEEFYKGTITTALIDMMKQASPDDAIKAARSLLHRVFNALQHMQSIQQALKAKGQETEPALISQLKAIFMQLIGSSVELHEILKTPNHARLERLYPITFIEALIRQIPDKAIVNNVSFGSIIKTELQEQEIVKGLNLQGQKLRAYITQYAKAGDAALVDMVKNNWDTYLTSLAQIQNTNTQQQFAKLLLDITQLDLMPVWLNTSFEQAYTKHAANAQSTTRELLQEYTDSSSFLEKLMQWQTYFESVNVTAWEEPNAFEKQWQSFKAIIDQLSQPSFIAALEQTTPLGKAAVLQVMNTAVSTFDQSIKSLTGSALYLDVSQKIERFKHMLQTYFNLLTSWAGIETIKPELNSLLDDYTFRTVEDYFYRIKIILDSLDNNPSQLQPSYEFNAAAATLGSKALWSRSIGYAPTLEDIFSLIHQNLLVIQGLFAKQTNIMHMSTPPVVEALKKAAEQMQIKMNPSQNAQAHLIGASFENNRLTYFYNMPIKHHSNALQITYDLQTKTATLSVQFYGDALVRWQKFGDIAYILSIINQTPITKPIEIDETRGLLSFTWQINSPEQAAIAMHYIEILARWTTVYFDEKYGNKPFIQIVAETTDPRNPSAVATRIAEEIINNTSQRPGLLLFIEEISKAFGQDHPLTKKAFQNLPAAFSKAPDNIANHIMNWVMNLIIYNKPIDINAILDVFKLVYQQPKLLKYENKAKQGVYKLILQNKISPSDAIAFIESTLLNQPDIDLKVQSLELFTVLILKGQNVTDIANEALTDIISNIDVLLLTMNLKEVYDEIFKLANMLLNENKLKNIPQLIELLKKTDFKFYHESLIPSFIQSLVSQNIEPNFTKDIAFKLLNSNDPALQGKGLLLLSEFIKRGELINEALEYIKNIESDNRSLNYGIYLTLNEILKISLTPEQKESAIQALIHCYNEPLYLKNSLIRENISNENALNIILDSFKEAFTFTGATLTDEERRSKINLINLFNQEIILKKYLRKKPDVAKKIKGALLALKGSLSRPPDWVDATLAEIESETADASSSS